MVTDSPDSAHLNVLIYPCFSGEFPVSLIVPGSILNDSSVHIGNIQTSIGSHSRIDKTGIKVGGTKGSCLPRRFPCGGKEIFHLYSK